MKTSGHIIHSLARRVIAPGRRQSGAGTPRGRILSLILSLLLISISPAIWAQQTHTSTTGNEAQATEALQGVVAKQAALVSEFEVNGLKVIVKRREGSLTVAAGLFIRGG